MRVKACVLTLSTPILRLSLKPYRGFGAGRQREKGSDSSLTGFLTREQDCLFGWIEPRSLVPLRDPVCFFLLGLISLKKHLCSLRQYGIFLFCFWPYVVLVRAKREGTHGTEGNPQTGESAFGNETDFLDQSENSILGRPCQVTGETV